MKRKMSNTSLYDIIPHSNVPRAEQVELQGLYKRVEHKGTGITFYDLVQMLRSKHGLIEIFTRLMRIGRKSCSRISWRRGFESLIFHICCRRLGH